MPARSIICLSVALAALTCGQAQAGPAPVNGAESGLGVTGPDTPDGLRAVADAPYAVREDISCSELAKEIADLDGLLGPDVDTPQAASAPNVGQAVGGAIKSLIPYRGVVRLVTGAGRKERELGQAMMAGSARRGFLRGLAQQKGCEPATPAAATTPVAAPLAPQAVARDVVSVAPQFPEPPSEPAPEMLAAAVAADPLTAADARNPALQPDLAGPVATVRSAWYPASAQP